MRSAAAALATLAFEAPTQRKVTLDCIRLGSAGLKVVGLPSAA